MQIGIIGLPYSGKTTVFNALTGSEAPVGEFSAAGAEPNIAVVKVPDPRLEALAKIFKPKKIVEATVTYVDTAGLGAEFSREQGFSGQFLNYIARVDALAVIVRAFEDPDVPHLEGSVDPVRDASNVALELMFSDLAIIERRLQRIEEGRHKVKPAERELQEQEAAVLSRLKAALEQEQPVRSVEISEDEEKLLRTYQFLTAKPTLFLVNLGDDQLDQSDAIVAKVRDALPWPKTEVDALGGKIEMEIAQLPEEDRPAFLADLGIEEPARDRVIRLSYSLLGLISFLTAGPDECRAWPIRLGTNAQKAAGTIHSDLERGFIRAEVVAFDDLIRSGGMTEAKRQGLVRSEGKNYVVKDGDVIEVLFNV